MSADASSVQRFLVAVTAAALTLGALAACSSSTSVDRSQQAATDRPREAAATVSARTLLDGLRVAAPDYSEPYDRERFGYGGDLDADGDGCFTRREVLIRDSLEPVEIGSSCFVTGEWRSLYDGRVTTDPSALSLDHVVPLAEAWHAGAWRWPRDRQVAFGNDLGYRWSLLAVTAALNEDKASSDPARWMPPDSGCLYGKAWIAVKSRWGLTVDPAEKAALTRILATCADERIERPGVPDVAALVGR